MPLIENFGRNVRFVPQHFYEPQSDAEVLKILDRHQGPGIRFRCVGGLHSWSRLAETSDVVLDLHHFDSVGVVSRGTGQRGDGARVRLGAGCTIARALDLLAPHGLTLPTLGAITRQTIAGAISTATHGSGAPSLSHFVEEVRVAGYDPSKKRAGVLRFTGRDELEAARCALGGLGVILDVVLRAQPVYRMEERFGKAASLQETIAARHEWPLSQFFLVPWKWRYYVYRRKPTKARRKAMAAWLRRIFLLVFIDFLQHAFLKWVVLPLTRVLGNEVVRGFLRVTPIPGFRRIDDSRHILTLRHDLFPHVEMEVFVPESRLEAAIESIRFFVETADARGTWTHHYPISFRHVLPDEALLSMTSRRHADDAETWVAISFFNYGAPGSAGFAEFAAGMAALLVERHEGRLHWGKYFPQDFRKALEQYPGFQRFEAVRRTYDPDDAFWITNL
jgi:L-gulonolactone oxidase